MGKTSFHGVRIGPKPRNSQPCYFSNVGLDKEEYRYELFWFLFNDILTWLIFLMGTVHSIFFSIILQQIENVKISMLRIRTNDLLFVSFIF